MTRRSGSSGLTRLDVLVVVVAGVFLLALAGPLASMPRNQATRAVCRANLARIGKAMLVYANEYEGTLPRAGGPTTVWGGPVIWTAVNRHMAYGVSVADEGGRATISSCLYLLVKHLEVPPRVFVCPADRGTKEFRMADEATVTGRFRLTDAWDFGAFPADNCSYAYHIPFGTYGLTTSRDPNLAVAADRNPWMRSPAAEAGDFTIYIPDVAPYNGTVRSARMGNSVSHQRDGQNVLFLDGHVTFEHRSFCGLDGDNIYAKASSYVRGDAKGFMAAYAPDMQPMNGRDSLLVHDPHLFAYTPAAR